MAPDQKDVARLVAALFVVSNGLERARRSIPDAAALSVLSVLGAVEQADPGRGARPSEIAAALDIHRSAVTYHLQTLTKAGHIQATTDPDDRRSSIISLTEGGHAELARLKAQGIARFASFVAAWSADEVRELARLLEKFEASTAKVSAQDPPPGAPPGWHNR
jgi:DNA-binding MarR family transcriptional regulator